MRSLLVGAICFLLSLWTNYSVFAAQPDNEYQMDCDSQKVGIPQSMPNPYEYYTCRDEYTPMLLYCQGGSGFLNNGTITGCVPWVLWNCTFKAGPPACTKDQQLTKYRHEEPSKFWICQGIGKPQELSCPEGNGFIINGVNDGCQPWSVWSKWCSG